MLPPEVVAYYECGDEQDRLTARIGRIEWARTWDLLQRHLPAPPATVLDVGGGPGAYAIPLALAGHRVHLVDAMPLHVQQARDAAGTTLASAEVGDARALAFPDTSADAVLLLGPLYHLLEAAERDAALAEARRVLRPGGVVMVGIEGPGRLLADVDDWLDDPDRREWLLHQLRRVEAEPSLLGASQHVMAVAHK
jgi:ubiquinone/menaquinone biosynthesis C-methylase UbiE